MQSSVPVEARGPSFPLSELSPAVCQPQVGPAWWSRGTPFFLSRFCRFLWLEFLAVGPFPWRWHQLVIKNIGGHRVHAPKSQGLCQLDLRWGQLQPKIKALNFWHVYEKLIKNKKQNPKSE